VAIETAIGSGVPGGFVTEGVEPAARHEQYRDQPDTDRDDGGQRQSEALRAGIRLAARGHPECDHHAIMVAPWGQPGGSAAFQIAGVLSDNVSESL